MLKSCRLFSAQLKFLAGLATKNQLACMSALPEPIRKPDVKFAKVCCPVLFNLTVTITVTEK